MAKSKKNPDRKSDSKHHDRVKVGNLSSKCTKLSPDSQHKKRKANASEKKEWKDARCSVCMEYPHNAVLLLCSSHDKGCRPYMCATSSRYSNCLEQYRKAYTKTGSIDDLFIPEESVDGNKSETSELPCPLCRGQVKGWTVVKRARRYLNKKKRTCMKDNCSYVGNYMEMRQHVRTEHPRARPRAVDPKRAEKWKKFEIESDLNDVFSTIRSTMPGATVVGDYVIERRDYFYGAPFRRSSLGGYSRRFRLSPERDYDSPLSGSEIDDFFGVGPTRSSVRSRRLGRNVGSRTSSRRHSITARPFARRTSRVLNIADYDEYIEDSSG